MTPEGKVKKEISAYLTEIGAYWRMPVLSGYGRPQLDYIGCHLGRFFTIEAKAPGKEPTVRQWMLIEEARRAGGLAFWCQDVSIVQVFIKKDYVCPSNAITYWTHRDYVV